MAEGTHHATLVESVAALKEETVSLREEQKQQKILLEAVLQKLGQVATNYANITNREPLALELAEGSYNLRTPVHHRFGSDGNQMIHARSLKLDFPKFDGNEPLEWLLKAEQFFEYFQTPEDHKLDIAFFHMEGKALAWFVWLKESAPIEGWEYFTNALKVRFGPSIYEDPIGAFTKLVQTTSVEDYQSQFEALSNKVKGVNEEFRISTFISGLKEEIKIMVTMFKPINLSAAFGLARLQEEEVNRRSKSAVGRTYPTTYANKPLSPKITTALTNNKLNTTTVPKTAISNHYKKPSFPIKRLTPVQMQERRDKGLCYNCDEKYHPGHRCSKPQLFMLEGLEELLKEEETEAGFQGTEEEFKETEDAANKSETVEISLHAIAGSLEPKTMRLHGSINNQKILILIDTGSTHSFIDPIIASKANLQVQTSHMKVKVATGGEFPCEGFCNNILIQLPQCKIITQLYVLTLGGCDVVLGVDWLK